MTGAHSKSMIKIFLKIAVTGLLFWWLATTADIAEVSRAVAAADGLLLILALLIFVTLSATQAFRWGFVARVLDIRISFPSSWGLILIGTFFNQALPSIVGGDAVRVFRLQATGFPVAASVNSVILDRFIAFIALIIIVALGQPVLFEIIGDQPWRWGMPLVVLLGVGLFVIVPTIDLLPLPGFVARSFIARGIEKFAKDARTILLTRRSIVPAL